MRLGIIGTNFITDRLLAAAEHLEDVVPQAVYSRTQEKADEFAEKHGLPSTYTDLEAFAASDEIDAVYIASPNALHHKQALLCMRNGKDVLCEKPIASNYREAEEMFRTAEEEGVVLMEAIKSVLMPGFAQIKSEIHKIGKVRRYVGNYCKFSSRYEAYRKGEVMNAFKRELSNGALMDLGVYGIYPMVDLFGAPTDIKATGVLLDTGVDGEGTAIFNYDEMEAVVSFSKIHNSYAPSEIQGEEGSIIIPDISTPEGMTIKYRDGTEEALQPTLSETSMLGELTEFSYILSVKDSQSQSFVSSPENSLETSRIMEEVRRQIGVVFPADE
ncbi:Gfo/Idh/MocA family protein [Salimicrobium flavidum]|uniref:Predicted dehydrogenase n=1 Tax=Salimicrobium flavidum TaxID=570947 RepID=A0A1N7IT85_9BACI|nr:Gfo/Idh/MocA family oxidoreductase [Salimicrobium flavidum]SIS40309.1 Predicted dehydrogenase [Salimicrobium flavidum]